MGKHSGEPVDETDEAASVAPEEAYEPAAPLDNKVLINFAAAITAAVVAWGFLVVEAIDFGGKARDGQSAAWFFLFMATIGATACMFLVLILGVKLLGVVRRDPPVRRFQAGGGKRASR